MHEAFVAQDSFGQELDYATARMNFDMEPSNPALAAINKALKQQLAATYEGLKRTVGCALTSALSPPLKNVPFS